MDKQQKLKIALPILVVVMLFVWGPVITGGGAKRKKKENIREIGANMASQGVMDLVALTYSSERRKARTAYADWGRNPFSLTQDPHALTVEGIVWDEENPKAIVNGNIVAIGDKIGLNVVVDIKHDRVVIKGKTGEIELRLGAAK